jgi:hypothetical protein
MKYNNMNLQEQISRIQSMMGVISESGDLKYDPRKVVHKDDEYIVIDKNMDDDTDEFKYGEDDISYMDDNWLVIDNDDSSEEMKEGEITEKCWKGYTQKGMKTMFGKRYPNCVKKTKK